MKILWFNDIIVKKYWLFLFNCLNSKTCDMHANIDSSAVRFTTLVLPPMDIGPHHNQWHEKKNLSFTYEGKFWFMIYHLMLINLSSIRTHFQQRSETKTSYLKSMKELYWMAWIDLIIFDFANEVNKENNKQKAFPKKPINTMRTFQSWPISIGTSPRQTL